MGLEQKKDARGKTLIRRFSLPDAEGNFSPCEGTAWDEFISYCKQDVRVEAAIHAKLKPFELAGMSLETFQFDLRMNQRGIL
jgi:DNA polymerase